MPHRLCCWWHTIVKWFTITWLIWMGQSCEVYGSTEEGNESIYCLFKAESIVYLRPLSLSQINQFWCIAIWTNTKANMEQTQPINFTLSLLDITISAYWCKSHLKWVWMMNITVFKTNTNHSPHKWDLSDQLKITFFFKLTQWLFDPTVWSLSLNSERIIQRRPISKWVSIKTFF